jgi:hypothetical protein
MEVIQAVENALLILEDETVRPTIKYAYIGEEWPRALVWAEKDMRDEGCTPSAAGDDALAQMRNARQREVEENPKLWRFESVNFELLLTIFGRVLPPNHEAFMKVFISTALEESPVARAERFSKLPSWNGSMSGLGLLAEFCIRTGHSKELFDSTVQIEAPSTPIAIMLRQIEEIIALNFNIFSSGDYDGIPERLAHLRRIGYQQTYWAAAEVPGEPPVTNLGYIDGLQAEGQLVVQSIDAIAAQCKQARYFYLKGALQETTNLEVENDKAKVVGFLVKLGFSKDMVGALNAAEAEYKSTATVFELKNCFGHLRSFLEFLHRESATAVAKAVGETVVDKWGATTLYLRQKGLFTTQHETFATSIYTLMSDTSVHPLVAERDYARLLRNVVIEYGVMFLTILDKNGVKIS